MRTVKFLLMALFVVCFSGKVYASDEYNAPVTLEQYIEIALANNAGLKASYQEFVIASEQIKQAGTLPDPKIMYGYATKETDQRYMFEVMQEFPWFGTIQARSDSASALAKSAFQKYEARKLQLLRDLKQWFYEYCYLAKSTEITRENLELVKHFEEVARTKYIASIAAHPDIIKAQIELAILEDTLKSLSLYRQPLASQLNNILNRPASAELIWPKRPEHKPVSLDFDGVISLIMQNNPDLKSLGYVIEAAKSNKKLSDKRFYPDLAVSVAFDDGMGKDMDTRVMPKISINLPIWTGSYKAGQRQAVAMLNQAALEQNQMQNTLAAQSQ